MSSPVLKTLPELTAASTPSTTDLIPIYQGANPLKKITATILGSYFVQTLLAYLQGATGSTARTVTSKLQESVSFNDFGTTLAKAQAALDASENVLFPSGTLTFSGGLTLSGDSDSIIHGDGWSSLFEHSGSAYLFTIGDTAEQRTADIRLAGMRADGNSTSPGFLDMKRQQHFVLDGVRANNFTGDAITLDRCYATKYFDFYLNNNGGGFQVGPFVDGAVPAGNDFMTFAYGQILASTGNAMHVEGSCPSLYVFRTDFEGNNSSTGTAALKIDAGTLGSHSAACTVAGCYFENNNELNASFGEGDGSKELRAFAFVGNNVNPGSGTAADNAVRFDYVNNGVVSQNSFSGANMVFTANVKRMLVGPNRFESGSTDSVWGSALPPIQYMHSPSGPDMVFGWKAIGWDLGHRAGVMRAGNTYTLSVNYSQAAGATTACTADDASYASCGMEISTENFRVMRAAVGVVSRTLIHGVPQIPVIATASLPAASSFMNGQAVIEDTGSALNLIIYGAGLRSRITATAF